MSVKRGSLVVLVSVLATAISVFAWRKIFPSETPSFNVLEDFGFVHGRLRGFQPEDADLQGPGWGAGLAMLKGHDISAGDRVVLFWRRFSDDLKVHDEEAFEMLTLELEDPEPGKEYRLDGAGIRGFYSKGSAGWGLGSYSKDLRGKLRVDAMTESEAVISFDLEAPMIRSHENRHFSWEVENVRRTLSCPLADQASLTAWQKGQRGHPH